MTLRERAPAATAPAAAPAVGADEAAGGEHGIARMKRWLLHGGRLQP